MLVGGVCEGTMKLSCFLVVLAVALAMCMTASEAGSFTFRRATPQVVVKVPKKQRINVVVKSGQGAQKGGNDDLAKDETQLKALQENSKFPDKPIETQPSIAANAYPNVQPYLHLVFEFPKVDDNNRQQEFVKALQMNIDHPLVKDISVFVSQKAREFLDQHPMNDPSKKMQLHTTSKQVLYSRLFRFTAHAAYTKGQIVVVMNADIEIGEGWEVLKKEHFETKNEQGEKVPVAFALSRYQRSDCGKYTSFCFGDGGGREKNDFVKDRNIKNYLTSHDAFVFLAPTHLERDSPFATMASNVRFEQNVMTAENRVIQAFRNAGYKVINPCFSLKTWHEHCTDIRHWGSPKSDAPPVTDGVAVPQALPEVASARPTSV